MTNITATAEPGTAARYGAGAEAPAILDDERGVIPLLLAHRSVRAFAATPLDEDVVPTLVAAAQSASTSSNLQTWSVVTVSDAGHKDRIATLAGDQDFIREAPLFLVFVADWARGRSIAADAGAGSEGIDFLDSTLVAVIDAAIAAQNAVVAAEALGLGAVYVGAVRNSPGELSDVLGLPRGSFPAVGVAIGHPRADVRTAVKPRLPQSVVRHSETYRAAESAEIAAYDDTLREYNTSQGRPRAWTDAVVERVRSADALHGRDLLRGILYSRGLASR
ncbi:nitroreductase family protein [Microbacterium sp. SS28]|uniref:nitroreductase family protein n=1 Tax=Microbacterium sp. SS28 TaxID=2919948 RepID=UPI001FAABA0F|nr:nitroreductase family protein [Microbacterium sp. SS28]